MLLDPPPSSSVQYCPPEVQYAKGCVNVHVYDGKLPLIASGKLWVE